MKKLEHSRLKRVNSERQSISVSHYCNDLNNKHNHIDQTINSYENIIKQLKNQNENVIIRYEEQYGNIDRIKFEYTELIEGLHLKIKSQSKKIIDMEIEEELINRQLEDEKIHYLQLLSIGKQSLDKADRLFSDEQQKIMQYKMRTDIRSKESAWAKKSIDDTVSSVAALEKKVDEARNENIKLKNQV